MLLAVVGIGYTAMLHGEAVEPSKEAMVAMIDQQPVNVSELRLVMHLHVAEIFQHYNISAGSADDRNFWERSTHAGKPIERLRARALEVLIEARCQMAIAKSLGISVPAFAQLAEGSRSDTSRRTAPVQFGITRNDASSIYLEALRRMRADIRRAMMLLPSMRDSDLQADYERQRARWRSSESNAHLTFAEVRATLLVERANAEFVRRCQALRATLQVELNTPILLQVYPGADTSESISAP